jgi:hypothetical protein
MRTGILGLSGRARPFGQVLEVASLARSLHRDTISGQLTRSIAKKDED